MNWIVVVDIFSVVCMNGVIIVPLLVIIWNILKKKNYMITSKQLSLSMLIPLALFIVCIIYLWINIDQYVEYIKIN